MVPGDVTALVRVVVLLVVLPTRVYVASDDFFHQTSYPVTGVPPLVVESGATH